MLFMTLIGAPHFSHFLSIEPSLIALYSCSVSLSKSLFSSGFRLSSMGFLPFLSTCIIGYPFSDILFAGLMIAFFGKLYVVLQSGYLLHAAKAPNLPCFIIMAPSLHTGQGPK